MFAPLRRARVLSATLILTLVAACTDDPPTGPRVASPGVDRLIVPVSRVFTQVGAGWDHTCAVRSDGVVECWGQNDLGQAPATRTAVSGSFVAVTAGGDYTCALRSDGVIECWGDNEYGQAPATKVAAAGTFTQISGGYLHACARRSDGVVECWGYDGGSIALATWTASSGTFTQVSAGYIGNCALRADGVVECLGFNRDGNAPPVRTAASGVYTQVVQQGIRGCARRNDGVIECWGKDIWGETPATKATAVGFTQVSLAFYWSCGLRTDGVIECWGDNGGGIAPPTKVAATGKFTQMSSGDDHHCALRSDGAVECWGNDNYGEAPAVRAATTFDIVFPTADFSATPNPVVGGQSFTLAFANAQVPGHPEATSFTYAFDCGDGNGWGTPISSPTVSCPTFAAGIRAVRGQVIDQDGHAHHHGATVDVLPPPDDTPPVIAATISGTLGSNGWYTSDVTVTWTVSDAESPVTSAPCASTTVDADTQGQTVSCSATSTGGTGSESVTIMRDATAPTLAPSVAPNPVLLNGSATATPNATDATSGLAAASCNVVVTSAVGSRTVSCTANDNAGNTASGQAAYSVTYGFSGFDAPVDGGGVLNVAKAGQTIPLEWRLLDAAGNPVTSLSGVTVSVMSLSCATGTSADALEEYAAGTSGLQNLGDGYYAFNWKSPKTYAGSCKTLHLNLGEGSTRTALFQFK